MDDSSASTCSNTSHIRKRSAGACKGSNNDGGRKLSFEWCHVTKCTDTDGHCECKYCKIKISSRIQRIKNHLKNCTEYQNQQQKEKNTHKRK